MIIGVTKKHCDGPIFGSNKCKNSYTWAVLCQLKNVHDVRKLTLETVGMFTKFVRFLICGYDNLRKCVTLFIHEISSSFYDDLLSQHLTTL